MNCNYKKGDFYEIARTPLLNLNQHIMSTRQVSWDEACFLSVYTCHFFYAPGYHLHRVSFDSFLLIYVKKEACMYINKDESFDAKAMSLF